MAEVAFMPPDTSIASSEDLVYAADSRHLERRVIARLEHGDKGANPRFVVANLKGDGGALYDRAYCQSDEQLHLLSGRTPCHEWWANQFRLLLASTVRSPGLKGTDMARAKVATIRLKLIKIGAVILRNTRRVRFHLSPGCPDKVLFRLVATRLEPG